MIYEKWSRGGLCVNEPVCYSYYDEKGKIGFIVGERRIKDRGYLSPPGEKELYLLNINTRRLVASIGEISPFSSYRLEITEMKEIFPYAERMGKRSLEDLLDSCKNIVDRLNLKIQREPWLKDYEQTLKHYKSDFLMSVGGACMLAGGVTSISLLLSSPPSDVWETAFLSVEFVALLGLGSIAIAYSYKNAKKYLASRRVMNKAKREIETLLKEEGINYRKLVEYSFSPPKVRVLI